MYTMFYDISPPQNIIFTCTLNASHANTRHTPTYLTRMQLKDMCFFDHCGESKVHTYMAYGFLYCS